MAAFNADESITNLQVALLAVQEAVTLKDMGKPD